jgi:hypothetical protein
MNELTSIKRDPNAKNFSFLKSNPFYISTNSHDEIELAFKEHINSNSHTITLITTD